MDPPSNLFRIKCSALIFLECIEFFPESENKTLLDLLNQFQLYYLFKKSSPVWKNHSIENQLKGFELP
ncbi:MAG: Regulator of nonsense transcripts upf2, partial [Paramarteilia canceri]